MSRPISSSLLADLDALADQQDGFVLASQMAGMSIPRSTVATLTRPGGPLRRVLPATYALGGSELTPRRRESAALLYAGRPALLTGSAAVRAYGLRYLPDDPASAPVHVLIEHHRTRASRGFARVERTLRFPPAIERGGRPLAPLPRALFDTARHCQDLRATRAMLLEALTQNRTSPAQLEREIRAGQRRWTAILRQVVREHRAGIASAPEAEFRAVWEARGLPPMHWNGALLTPSGRFIARPDCYDEEVGMAVENDSREYHSGPRYAETVERHRRLATYGIVVCSIVPSQFRADPEGVIADVLKARESLIGRPPPAVVVVPFGAE